MIHQRGLTQLRVAREPALPQSTVGQCVGRGMRELAGYLTVGTGSGCAGNRGDNGEAARRDGSGQPDRIRTPETGER